MNDEDLFVASKGIFLKSMCVYLMSKNAERAGLSLYFRHQKDLSFCVHVFVNEGDKQPG